MTNVNLLKSIMAKNGDLNFVACLASLLGAGRSTASKRLNGKTEFTQSEIATITEHYDLTAEDIKKIFVGE